MTRGQYVDSEIARHNSLGAEFNEFGLACLVSSIHPYEYKREKRRLSHLSTRWYDDLPQYAKHLIEIGPLNKPAITTQHQFKRVMAVIPRPTVNSVERYLLATFYSLGGAPKKKYTELEIGKHGLLVHAGRESWTDESPIYFIHSDPVDIEQISYENSR